MRPLLTPCVPATTDGDLSSPAPRFARLKISKSEQKRWFDEFEKVDVNHNGNVTIDEFFDYVDIDFSDFAVKAFEAMDMGECWLIAGSLARAGMGRCAVLVYCGGARWVLCMLLMCARSRTRVDVVTLAGV